MDPLTCDFNILSPMNPDFGPNLEPEPEYLETPIWHELKLKQLARQCRSWFKNAPKISYGVMGYEHEPEKG